MTGRVVSKADVSTDGVELVLLLSPQSLGLDKGLSGYVVLIAPDGSYSMLETSGMNTGEIDWREGGVFFSDTEYDYFLTETLKSVVSPKANVQRTLFFDERAGKYVGLYNHGFSQDGYVDHLVVSDVDSSEVTEVEGSYSFSAQCDGVIYGVAPISGRYLTGEARQVFDSTFEVGQMLTQLYPLDNGSERLVTTTEAMISSEPRGNAPCVEGRISYPSFNYTGGSHGDMSAVLKTWNSQTGELQERKLTDSDGVALALGADDVIYAEMLPMPVNGKLVWALTNGDVLATDLGTAETSVIHSFAMGEEVGFIHLKVYEDRLWMLEVPTTQSSPVVLHSAHLQTGENERSVEVDGISEMLSSDLVLRDFAISPDRISREGR